MQTPPAISLKSFWGHSPDKEIMTQLIPILEGFKRITWGDRQLPNDQVLIELLSPGSDPKSALTLHCENDFLDTKELESQMLLQKYSNQQIYCLAEDYSGSQRSICELAILLGEDAEEARHAHALIEYLNFLLHSSTPNIKTMAKWTGDVARAVDRHQMGAFSRDEKSFHLRLESNRGAVINDFFSPMWGQELEQDEAHTQRLGERFPEYQAVTKFLEGLSLKFCSEYCQEAGRLIAQAHSDMTQRVVFAANGYKKGSKPPTRFAIRQCPFCFKWFEQELTGGRLRIFCGGKGSPCYKTWDSNRRRTGSGKREIG
jgi:hypothetical protein